MSFNIGQDVLPHEYTGAIYNRIGAVRLKFILSVFAVVFAMCIVRTLQLALQNNVVMQNNSSRNMDMETRADIVDRNGIVLAKTVKIVNIKLYPNKVKNKDIDAVANVIHDIAPMEYSVSDALNLIRSDKPGLYVKMNASEEQVKKIEDVNRTCNCFDTKEKFFERHYPQRNVFSHIVGFVGKESVGLEGMEHVYDKYLRENKDPLRLSIDSRVQNTFHEQLSIAMEKYQAKSAMGMLMNSTTGEIVAMVQLPDFDPNNYSTTPKWVRSFKLLRDNFEMGSVFKIFNTALAYENGLEDNVYDVSKPLTVKDRQIKDMKSFYRDIVNGAGKSRMKAQEIMLYSCNTGSAQIALDLPENAQKEFFKKLNFDKPLKLEFGRTETGLTHKHWGQVEKATASFGHGITVTPMHLLLGINAVTNGGIYIYPTLLKRNIGAIRGERILNSDISAKLREIMFRVVEETTAKKARVNGVKIGGKTGTGEKRKSDGTIDKNRNVTVFAGVFPISTPQYVILIVLDEPKGTTESGGWKTAAWNAVPTAGAILNRIMPLLFE